MRNTNRFPTVDSVKKFLFGENYKSRQDEAFMDGYNTVAEMMVATGACLWHAQSIVYGIGVCHCAKCNGTSPFASLPMMD